MTKQEFLEKVAALRAQRLQYEKEYAESNITYPVGTKLKVTNSKDKTRFGIVKGQLIEYDEVVPYVTLIMKNGDLSDRRVVIGENDKVEIVD